MKTKADVPGEIQNPLSNTSRGIDRLNIWGGSYFLPALFIKCNSVGNINNLNSGT